ncbi:hypothetical protein BKA00_003451 [Actinomadura coerulea]|uniref:Uncharacterized protein n=1 Tax=Actinomadura coerulea TaxID=46159 RepID=A0A7X0FZC2_9ACTN|nr:hypothetical protein [Actinomadura coerulea]MBB6396537.1 hypothetical protein [Actinomadura coerulea]GGQ05499.1 hypothetical protein GCM10010187_21770 [Actinomadura coerulea]
MPEDRSHDEYGERDRAVDALQTLTVLFLIAGYSAWFLCVYAATLLDGP